MPELCTLIFCIWIRRTRSARPVNGLVVRFCCLLHSTSFKMCFSAKSPGTNGLNYFFYQIPYLAVLQWFMSTLYLAHLVFSGLSMLSQLRPHLFWVPTKMYTHKHTCHKKKKQENIYLFKGLPLAERDSCQVNASRPWHFDPQFQHYLTWEDLCHINSK